MSVLIPVPMEIIEVLRDTANRLAFDTQALAHDLLARREAREELAKVEEAIATAIAGRAHFKPCPFCASGVWVKTPTVGRMACDGCGAMALVGSYRAIVPDPALDIVDE